MPLTLTRLSLSDAAEASRLHAAAFPDFFLSRLGTPFLQQFYQGFAHDETAVTVVARDTEGVMRGVAVGTTEPAGFFSRLLRTRWQGFAFASLRAALRRPRTAPRLLRALSYRGDGPTETAGALLSSLCIDPRMQGIGIGKLVLNAWVADVAGRSVSQATLTTDADGNDRVNHFYTSCGWRLSGTFITREGRVMNQYTILTDR